MSKQKTDWTPIRMTIFLETIEKRKKQPVTLRGWGTREGGLKLVLLGPNLAFCFREASAQPKTKNTQKHPLNRTSKASVRTIRTNYTNTLNTSTYFLYSMKESGQYISFTGSKTRLPFSQCFSSTKDQKDTKTIHSTE